MKTLTMLRDATLDLLFPPRCEVCHTLQEPVICPACLQQLTPITDPRCLQCGLPFDPLAQTMSHCAECRDDPPSFDAARASGVYGGALRRAIHAFKYEMVRALANPLGDFMAKGIEPPFPVECLCPVPLHPSREGIRGFNQSLLLAERLAMHWQLPVQPHLLARRKNTTPQMQLPHDQRRQNIKGVFAVEQPLTGRTIGLVDDVYTTGSTLRECSKMLKRAGAERILVITLARAI